MVNFLFSSWFALCLIFVGTAAVVAGNIIYPLAKAAEDKQTTANTVWSTLKLEVQENLTLAQAISPTNEQASIYFKSFSTGAWQAVSGGSLIVSLNVERREKLIKAYMLINRANDYHERILENLTGISSALNSVQETRAQLMNEFKLAIIELKPILKDLIENGVD